MTNNYCTLNIQLKKSKQEQVNFWIYVSMALLAILYVHFQSLRFFSVNTLFQYHWWMGDSVAVRSRSVPIKKVKFINIQYHNIKQNEFISNHSLQIKSTRKHSSEQKSRTQHPIVRCDALAFQIKMRQSLHLPLNKIMNSILQLILDNKL